MLPRKQTPLFGLLRVGLGVALTGLAGCITTSPDSGTRDVFLHINDLCCSDADGFSAAGHLFSLNSLEGVAFHSPDRGLTWRRSVIEGGATGISLGLLVIPGGMRFITGYEGGSSLLAHMSRQYSLQPGPWWSSADGQKTWQPAVALFSWPAGRGFGQKPPQLFAMRDGAVLLALAQTSDAVVALRSVDHGASWQAMTLPQVELLRSVVVNAQGEIAASGLGGRGLLSPPIDFVVTSRDAGETWTAAASPSALALYLTPKGSVVGFNHDDRKYGRTLLYWSAGIGDKWKKAADFDGGGKVTSMGADNQGRVIAITENGQVLLSDDDGATWRNQGKSAATNQRLPLRRPMFFSMTASSWRLPTAERSSARRIAAKPGAWSRRTVREAESPTCAPTAAAPSSPWAVGRCSVRRTGGPPGRRAALKMGPAAPDHFAETQPFSNSRISATMSSGLAESFT